MPTSQPPDIVGTRNELQRVATHLLARARFEATGRFGLRVTWDGIATPAFGPDGDVLRIAGGLLVHESQRSGPAASRASRVRLTEDAAPRSLEPIVRCPCIYAVPSIEASIPAYSVDG